MRPSTIYITWLNNLGGFEYFFFTGKNAFNVEVEETSETRKNILPSWPRSYGKTADTIRKQTKRVTRNQILVRSQHLTLNQLDALSQIRTSPLVQIVYSRTNRRTVIVDSDSFKKYDEQGDNAGQFSLQFTVSYTDENPSQTV